MNRNFVASLLVAALTVLPVGAGKPGAEIAAQPAERCYSRSELTNAFRIVLPMARVEVLNATQTRRYLALFNKIGPPSRFAGDEMIVVAVAPASSVILVPLQKGIGCQRMMAGARLHKAIMNTISDKGV